MSLRSDSLSSQSHSLLWQIGEEHVEALYAYAKFRYECGDYSGAAAYLYQYRSLCTNADKSMNALWGKVATEILVQNWDVAAEELNKLKEIIDSKVSATGVTFEVLRVKFVGWRVDWLRLPC